MNFQTAKERLIAALEDLLEKGVAAQSEAKIIRIEINGLDLDLLSWLAAQSVSERFYWSDQESLFMMAGIGVAHQVRGYDVFGSSFITDDKRVRYYGGFCFDMSNVGDVWGSFADNQFVLPLIECVSRDGEAFLCANVVVQDSLQEAVDHIKDTLEKACVADKADLSLPSIKEQVNQPNQEEWERSVQLILDTEERGDVQKVVLSRRSDVAFDEPMNAAALLKKLASLAPTSNRFYFQFNDTDAFFGASPERLFRREKNVLKTYAIAGTRPRLHDDQDEQRKEDLLQSDKERAEHAFVVNWIKQRMAPFARSMDALPEPSILALNHSFHLCTTFDVLLHDEEVDRALIEALHPTPAVAGYPQDEAMAMIKGLEPFSRGWFAGPVACVGQEEVDVVVAIRSALVCGKMMHVYAGAGIVRGSEPSDEWDEVDNKIFNMRKVLETLS